MFDRAIRTFTGFPAIFRGSNPAGEAIDRAAAGILPIPMATTPGRGPGGLLPIFNSSRADIRLDLGGLSSPIPCGQGRTFGPLPAGRLDLAIWAIEDGRPDRLLSAPALRIASPPGRRPGWWGAGGREGAIAWEWDGIRLRPISHPDSIPCAPPAEGFQGPDQTRRTGM